MVSQLKSSYFSLIIDETTDVSITKELAVVCRYYDNNKHKVVIEFYEMIPIVSATTESIFKHLADAFDKDGIPLANIFGFHNCMQDIHRNDNQIHTSYICFKTRENN